MKLQLQKILFENNLMNFTYNQISDLQQIKNPFSVLSNLSKIDWNFTKDKTSYLTHDIHPYPAKFIPQIPKYLILELSRPGEIVWDPFAGSGTTALEAVLLNRKAVSTDLNPLSTIIGEAKTTTLTKEDEIGLEEHLENVFYISQSDFSYENVIIDTKQERSNLVPDIANIKYWFNETAIVELAYLRSIISAIKSEKQKVIAKVAFSRTVSKVSNQDSETRYSRRLKNVLAKYTLNVYANELKSCIDKSNELGNLLNFREAKFATLDLRKPCIGIPVDPDKKIIINKNSIDLIITSPPYPNANDYHLYHRFRLFWLGFDPRELASSEIGSHLRHQKEGTGFSNYLSEMEKCLENMFIALRPGRYAVLVIGDAIFKGKKYSTSDGIKKIAKNIGFNVAGVINRTIHRTKRSFISTARRADNEQILILQKPEANLVINLFPPNYKLWPYENVLRKIEIERKLNINLITNTKTEWSIKTSSLNIDKIRSLTFTHAFSIDKCSPEYTWQALVENGHKKRLTSKKASNYITHGIHAYKGKFYPQLCKTLFNIGGLNEGNRILDPFCGSGTSILEGYLNGLDCYGCDANPLAVKIAKAKTEILTVEPLFRDKSLFNIISQLPKEKINGYENWMNEYSVEAQKEILLWFPKQVIFKIATIFGTIKRIPHPILQNYLEILLSSIVRQISQQDPQDLRIRRRKQPLVDAPVIELFIEVLVKQRERLLNFDRIRNDCPVNFGKVNLWKGDSRDSSNFSNKLLKGSYIDAVISSPPYSTALPYIDTDRLSLLLLFGMSSNLRRPIETELVGTREIFNSSKRELECQIENDNFGMIKSNKAQLLIKKIYWQNKNAMVGFRKKNQASLLFKYFSDMSACMQNIDKCIKPKGKVFLILGDSITTTEKEVVPIRTIEIIKEIGENIGWINQEDIKISVTKDNLKHIKNSITENSILLFSK